MPTLRKSLELVRELMLEEVRRQDEELRGD